MNGPEYDLNDVKAAARRLNIEYRGRIVQRDINNLGYELADVARCVMRLSVDDHRSSIRYEDRPTDDVYMCTFTRVGNEESGSVHIPAHREHPFWSNVNTYSGLT